AYSLKLLGGRLLPGPNGPAAMFMYETPTGERYTFYCARANAPRTALRYNAAGDTAAVLWVESEIGYVVSGPAERERLIEIAPRPTSSVVRMPCIRPLRVGVGRARMIRRYWPFELTRR